MLKLLTAVLVVGLLGCAQRPMVTGDWVLSVDLGGQGGDATFELQEGDDGALTGSYTGALGRADVSGMVKDGNIEMTFDSQAGKVTYQGEATEDTMAGTVTYGQLGSGTFSGKRQD